MKTRETMRSEADFKIGPSRIRSLKAAYVFSFFTFLWIFLIPVILVTLVLGINFIQFASKFAADAGLATIILLGVIILFVTHRSSLRLASTYFRFGDSGIEVLTFHKGSGRRLYLFPHLTLSKIVLNPDGSGAIIGPTGCPVLRFSRKSTSELNRLKSEMASFCPNLTLSWALQSKKLKSEFMGILLLICIGMSFGIFASAILKSDNAIGGFSLGTFWLSVRELLPVISSMFLFLCFFLVQCLSLRILTRKYIEEPR